MSLFGLLNRIPKLNELHGAFGEFLTTNYAKLFTDTLVLHDVLIEGANGNTSQIDMILIDAKGLYVAEIKTYTDAVIYGDGTKRNWYYYKNGRKYEIYNPLEQNKSHIRYLKRFLSAFGDVPCFSLIVMLCKDFKVSNINKPGEKEAGVCNSFPSMKEVMRMIGEEKDSVFDDTKRLELFNFIKEHQLAGRGERAEHKQKTIEYEKSIEDLKTQHICPLCRAPLVLREGKYGPFYGCSNYPKCRYTQKL